MHLCEDGTKPPGHFLSCNNRTRKQALKSEEIPFPAQEVPHVVL